MADFLIACRPHSYGKFKEEAFRHLPAIGIRHVEIHPPPPAEWPGLRAQLKELGLSVSTVGGAVDLSREDQVLKFVELADAAVSFGARIIFLSVKTGGLPKENAYGILRKLGDVARERGVTIALETHPDLVSSGDEAVATMRGVSHPNVKLNYDSANIYFYNEGVDGVEELKKFLPWLGAVHLKETNGKFKEWYFPGLHEGEGIVNFPEIFRICEEIGFRGPFTLEIEGIKGESLNREQTLERMEKTASYLRSIGAL